MIDQDIEKKRRRNMLILRILSVVLFLVGVGMLMAGALWLATLIIDYAPTLIQAMTAILFIIASFLVLDHAIDSWE